MGNKILVLVGGETKKMCVVFPHCAVPRRKKKEKKSSHVVQVGRIEERK